MGSDKEIREKLKGKRLLLLGGSLWKEAIQKIAEKYQIVLAATGNDQSAGIFDISEEGYDVNSTDSEAMKRLIKEKNIDGVYMGGSEAVISSACEYLSELGYPCYCSKKQWEELQDKNKFKELCVKHGLPVANKWNVDEGELDTVTEFPVITKPTDGCGSSGFSVCHNGEELRAGYRKARKASPTGNVIVEKFVKNDGIVVFYTMSGGELIFSGLEDKYPVRYSKQGSYVGGLFVFESGLAEEFCRKFEDQIKSLVSEIGITEGTFWIEVFFDGTNYYFNEAGYRYGGSASIYPINYIYGINQVAADIYYALTGESHVAGFPSMIPEGVPKKKFYAVYPVYAKAGTIQNIKGEDLVQEVDRIVAILLKKEVGDRIADTGTFSQAVALAHIVFDEEAELKNTIHKIHERFQMLDEAGNNLIYPMLDLESLRLKGTM